MIKRSILVCCAVIPAWHLIMPHLPGYYTIPGQQRANYLHAQTFVHDAPPDARVIVGSSMADRLDELKLGHDHVKLAFPGGGPFTGLEIIRRTGRRPPVVWIESNVILRDAEVDLLENVLSPWRRGLRDRSPVFKEEGRPSNYGVGFAKAVIGKVCKLASSVSGGVPKSADASQHAMDTAVFDDIMKENRAHLDRQPAAADLAQRVERLGKYVDELTAAGSKCVWFEMPIDASLRNLAEPAAIRKALTERFPSGKYRWLDLSRATPYQTTDGIHLVPADADFVIGKMLEFEKGLE